ncbi:MAG: M55 family metallopeptidase [Fimbriimonadaceae bacterium]|jgi:D-amino peptidase|nr:M55 family metallopeptidase [Fimbriimonadaceae bacterium]
MRVFISADIEGVTGLVNWAQCGGPNDGLKDWDFARKMMTHDVNSAIEGALDAGAKEIVVRDGHGKSKNLLISELHPKATLISGFGSGFDGMMEGIDSGFSAALLVGYHAMAGTMKGVMEHTITGSLHRLWINQRPAGEIALSALTAGYYGVPVVAISSDRAGCEEFADWIPGASRAEVKVGLGRYMAHLKHPSQTGPLIRQAATEGLKNVAAIAPIVTQTPITITLEQNRSEEADAIAILPGWKRIDGFTVTYTAISWPEAHRACRTAMSFATIGRMSGD